MTDSASAFGRALFGDPEPEPEPEPEKSRRRDSEPDPGTEPDGSPAGQQPGPEPEGEQGEQADEPAPRGETVEERFNESTVSVARGPTSKTEADRRFFEKLMGPQATEDAETDGR